MELINKYKGRNHENSHEYFCELTDELDKLAGLKNDDEYYSWRHYVLVDNFCIKERFLAIRIPGGTVGGIWIDGNNVITKIVVDTDYIVKTYPKDINKQIEKFINCKIDNLN